MEASGVVYKTVPRFLGTRVEFGGLGSRVWNLGVGDSRVSSRHRNSYRRLNSQFSDPGHVQYYVSPKAGICANKEKGKSFEIKTVKKKLKFIEKLSKDLSMLPQMAAGEDIRIGLIADVKEASDVLLAQLQQLRSEQKELQRKLKERRAQLRANLNESESSSSSEEVVDMKTLRTNSLKPSQDTETPTHNDVKQPEKLELPTMLTGEVTLANVVFEEEENIHQIPEGMEVPMVAEKATLANSLIELENSDSSPATLAPVPYFGIGTACYTSNGNILLEGASASKIEVCMGGKCKKLGAAALLEEFERKLGAEATVVTCKCMGKCKTAPNVRVQNSSTGTDARSSTCTAVVLQDVDLIVANLLGQEIDDECLILPS